MESCGKDFSTGIMDHVFFPTGLLALGRIPIHSFIVTGGLDTRRLRGYGQQIEFTPHEMNPEAWDGFHIERIPVSVGQSSITEAPKLGSDPGHLKHPIHPTPFSSCPPYQQPFQQLCF